jgi:hypothetical protein
MWKGAADSIEGLLTPTGYKTCFSGDKSTSLLTTCTYFRIPIIINILSQGTRRIDDKDNFLLDLNLRKSAFTAELDDIFLRVRS